MPDPPSHQPAHLSVTHLPKLTAWQNSQAQSAAASGGSCLATPPKPLTLPDPPAKVDCPAEPASPVCCHLWPALAGDLKAQAGLSEEEGVAPLRLHQGGSGLGGFKLLQGGGWWPEARHGWA